MSCENEGKSGMPSREILIVPGQRLRQVAHPVEHVDKAIRRLVRDMFAAMYQGEGIGLAAVQIGEPLRIVTIDLMEGDTRRPRVFINPLVIWQSEQAMDSQEGCLSVPGYYDHITRSVAIGSFRDLDGKPREIKATGLLAVCLQHEIDHLDGVLFVDRIQNLRRRFLR